MNKGYMVVLTDNEGSEVLFMHNSKKQCEAYAECILLEEGYEAVITVEEV